MVGCDCPLRVSRGASDLSSSSSPRGTLDSGLLLGLALPLNLLCSASYPTLDSLLFLASQCFYYRNVVGSWCWAQQKVGQSQGTWKSSLSFCVEASGVITVSYGGKGSEFFNGISTACQRQYAVLSLFVPYRTLCIFRVPSQTRARRMGSGIRAKRSSQVSLFSAFFCVREHK
jgi:hypothetical protein